MYVSCEIQIGLMRKQAEKHKNTDHCNSTSCVEHWASIRCTLTQCVWQMAEYLYRLFHYSASQESEIDLVILLSGYPISQDACWGLDVPLNVHMWNAYGNPGSLEGLGEARPNGKSSVHMKRCPWTEYWNSGSSSSFFHFPAVLSFTLLCVLCHDVLPCLRLRKGPKTDNWKL